MKNFYEYLIRHQNKYPALLVQDYLKLIFQSEFAGGHLIKSKDISLKFLESEASSIQSFKSKELYEYISDNIIRINIEPYLQNNLVIKNLNDLFFNSSLLNYSGSLLNNKITTLEKLLYDQQKQFSDYYLINNFKQNPTIFSHTNTYKENYHPHYRVISTELLPMKYRFLKFQNYLDSLDKSKLTIIAVEGKHTSGKTTICKMLKNITLIHADDFFSKTNLLDYKLLEQLITKLEIGKTIEYTVYDYTNDNYYQKTISNIQPIVIIEGIYCYSNNLKKYYNKLVYFEISKDLQISRLNLKIIDKTIINLYLTKWIPQETEYFNNNNFIESADIII